MKGEKSNFHMRAISMKPNCLLPIKINNRDRIRICAYLYEYEQVRIHTTIRIVIETA